CYRMLLTFYASAMRLLTPLLNAYLARRRRRGKEDAARFQERRGVASRPRPEGSLIWCHAASVGEAQSLLSVIARLREQAPQVAILVTTGTVTSAKLMGERLPQGAFHQYVPVD